MNDELIKKKHERTIRSLFRIITSRRKLLKSCQLWMSLGVSIILTAYVLMSKLATIDVISTLTELCLNVLPNIIGFNLGAYVLFISLSSDRLLYELTDDYNDEEYSTYQHISSVFAWSILVQILALIVAWSYKIIISFEITLALAEYFNSIVLILFLSTYAIFLIYRIIMNVFTIGQVIHFFTIINKEESNEKQNSNTLYRK